MGHGDPIGDLQQCRRFQGSHVVGNHNVVRGGVQANKAGTAKRERGVSVGVQPRKTCGPLSWTGFFIILERLGRGVPLAHDIPTPTPLGILSYSQRGQCNDPKRRLSLYV